MKKFLLTITLALNVLMANAVPACPDPGIMTQPDGTTVTLRLHGDEFYHFETTLDGYTVMKDSRGYYTYATLNEAGMLVSTGIAAHDAGSRTADELRFTDNSEKYLIDTPDSAPRIKAKAARANSERRKVGEFDYSNFRGLVLLINYQDTKFTRSDANEFYNRMINEQNYSGFKNEDGSRNRYGTFTGSVRDYYYDNSLGKFDPQFTVVGPVDVDYNVTDGGNGYYDIFKQAITRASEQGLVNFADYDTDNDGYVDMVYFIVAGGGANFQGNDQSWLWPHKSVLWGVRANNVNFGLYACSVEMYGPPEYGIIDGIGTMCHEFSHVLGLPDLYDTDYATGGQSHDPGEWEVMAGGSYNNYSRTPVGYSLYDRHALGFSEAKVIKGEGEYAINPLGTSGEGYKLLTATQNEFFLLENRQSTKWDAYLPGHGMIIARVDSTNFTVWADNTVNARSSRNYYELLRAGMSTSGDSGSDPFPGTNKVMMVTNITKPNLRSYGNKPNDYILTNITESNNVISFTVATDGSLASVVEDFEIMPVGATRNEKDVQSLLYRWDFTQSSVMEPADKSLCHGNHALGMTSPSMISATSDLYLKGMYLVTCYVNNPTTAVAKLKLSMSTDHGETWQTVYAPDDTESQQIAAKSETEMSWGVNTSKPVRFRLNQLAGAKRDNIFVDDISFYYDDSQPSDEVVVTSVEITPNSTDAKVGDQIQLTANVLPNNATNRSVSWRTSNEEIAQVDNKGLVTILSPGDVTISALSNDGTNLRATCTIAATTGITDVRVDNGVNIMAKDGSILLGGADAEVFSTTGTLIYRGKDQQVDVAPGIYIVRAGGKTVKVAVK